MTIAIMQPYLFPYFGYFQLIHAVDKFVILDDVNYIKKGWINRNRILVNNKEYLFTIPVKNVSQNKHINELFLIEDEKWKTKLIRTLEDNYKKAKQYKEVSSLICSIIYFKEINLSKYIINSIKLLNKYLEIPTYIISGSSIYLNSNLKGQDKIIDICKKENADTYYNLAGGVNLYSYEDFRNAGIELKFIKSSRFEYHQFNSQFIPYLSIIDTLMHNSKDDIKILFKAFEIL